MSTRRGRGLLLRTRYSRAGRTGWTQSCRRRRKLTHLPKCDYSDYMTATLRETKAKLSEMVRLASQGEEVVITVHGKQVAKLVGLPKRPREIDKRKWLAKLARLRKQTGTGIIGMTAQEIQDENR